MTEQISPAKELASLLRSRRERLSPEQVQLPPRRSARRTPGLRREEVAELAGVSVDYVTRLEQGRGLRPSPEVLNALAGALRLTEDERSYLFDLAQQRPTGRRRRAQPTDSLARLVLDLSPLPAMVVNHRFDIVAWNPQMSGLMIDLDAMADRERNALRMCGLNPDFADYYPDREQILREAIADLRAAWAAHPEDAELAELVNELIVGSEEFARCWALRDVRVNGRGRKALQHPWVGWLTIDFEVLTPLQDPDQRLIIYRAVDVASQAALDRIARIMVTEKPALHAM